jgi:hypothetical protein
LHKGRGYPQIWQQYRFPDGLRYNRCAQQCQLEFNHYGGPAGNVDYYWVGWFRPDLRTNWLGVNYPVDDLRDTPFDFFFTLTYYANNDLTKRGILLRVDRSDGAWEQSWFPWEPDVYRPVAPGLPGDIHTVSPDWGLLYAVVGIGGVDWYDYPRISGWHLIKSNRDEERLGLPPTLGYTRSALAKRRGRFQNKNS